MFGINKDGKPVNLVVTDHTFVAGEVMEKGRVLEQVESDLALELAAAGKVRAIADDDELKSLKAAWKRSQQQAAAPAPAPEVPAGN